jgi:hypothetical protein
VTVNGGTGGNTFSVQSTQAGTAPTVNAGGGNDTVNLGSTANKLDTLQGPVAVNGQAGSDTLNLNDQGQTAGQGYTLTSTTVARPGMGTVTFGTVENLTLSTGGGNDTVTLGLPILTAATTINGGGGSNTLVGPNATNTWTIGAANAGTVGKVTFASFQNLVGGTGNDTFKFTGASPSVAGTIGGGAGVNKLDYSGYTGGAVSVNLQTLAASLINGGAAGGFSGIGALAGNTNAGNMLTAANTANTWSLTGADAGKLNSFSFTGIGNLVGGTGLDVFAFKTTSAKVTSIDGGGAPAGQGDWLDYSAYAAAVTVNLATGAATGVTGSVSHVQNVHDGNHGNTLTGDAQGNILIGGSGTNTITGGSGHSILIADKGPSTITGGSGGSSGGGDILIGGTTSYDTMTAANEAALMSILAEWQSTDSYATRFSDIDTGTGGGLNGSNKLNWGKTVLDNGKANTLTAQAGTAVADWFFANTAPGHTIIKNEEAGEHLNNT